MSNLKEDFIPMINRNSEANKEREARQFRVNQQHKIAEQKKQEKKSNIRRNIVIAVASYLVIANLLGAGHAYNELAAERGAEKYFHKDVGTNYVFENGEEPTIDEVLKRMGENPEDLFFPTWVFEDDNEIRR